MNISPPAPIGNSNGPTVYRIDLIIGQDGMPHNDKAASKPKQPNRQIPSNDQQKTVIRCSGDLHGINGANNNSTPMRVAEKRNTWWGLDLVNPNNEFSSSNPDTAKAVMMRGRMNSWNEASSLSMEVKPKRTRSHTSWMAALETRRNKSLALDEAIIRRMYVICK